MRDYKDFEIRQYRLVFPNTLNSNNTLFGGLAMQWMDELAYICAVKFIKKKMVTVSMDKTHFRIPVATGSIVELIAKIEDVGNAKIKIKVEVYSEETYTENKNLAIDTVFTFGAVNEDNSPTRLFDK